MTDAIVAELRAGGSVFADEEAELLTAAASTSDVLRDMVRRRVEGVPLEHIVGWVEFCGLRLSVQPGVFVPRKRTETLVAQANAHIAPHATVIDLCCGCGAIGAALLKSKPLHVYAVDLDPPSVQCARANLPGAHVFQGDLFTPLPPGLKADAIVANVPYVPSAEIEFMPPEARLYEPHTALDGGADGLDLLRRVAIEAPAWLNPGGYLFFEASDRQADAACAALRGSGFLAEFLDGVVTGQIPH